IGIISVTEVCRRSVGLPIVIVAACFIVYAMVFGLHNPSFMKKLNYLVRNLFYTKEGILSTPINACSKFIVIFIIFGSFLERSGVADFFIKISNAIVGGFSGGPAKVAVVASALEGMVSGSSVANTVGSGSVTIPLMKKTGYKPEFAAAAEASASTGGQIMPPIMGAAAFLMADFLGAPYSVILLCAIIPAVLYFAGVFITVHLEAKKEGLRGLTKEELPKIKPLLKELYLLIPLILLIYLVTSNKCTIQFAAALSIGAVILVSIASILINKKETTFVGFIKKMVKDIFDALSSGGQGVITVAAACAVAGIISGVITMTGLANILFNGIVALAGNQVIIALFLTMICCIVLGMGVPTTANYCIMAATCAPILIRMGVPQIAAHFFVFYFGIVADLTPPVALAAYAGAAIAQANPMKTAVTATKLAIGAFIIPYIFALNPTLLVALCGPEVISETLNMTISVTAVDVIIICITSLVGMFAVSASLEGYMMHRMSWYERIMSVAGGLLLIYPGLTTDIIGLALVVAVVLLQLATRKKYAVNV
ncbi:MAG: TRAP transporter fused permease subunit, partial [Oscillospiraceae bacterium]|nr:TRAP transporter fused permease subunit [Oscillospiraceae bacterium]